MSLANETPVRSAAAAAETVKLRSFTFTIYMTMALVTSFFPLYFADLGFSGQQIGVLYAIGPGVSIFANILIGMISDRYRTIKKLLALLLAGQIAAVALLLPSTDYAAICLIMVLFYFCQTPVNPLTDSLILLSVPHTGRSFPSIRILGSCGFAFSALAVGFFLKEQGAGATMTVCLMTAALAFALSFALKERQGAMSKMDFSGFFQVIRQRELLIFFGLAFTLSVAARMNDGFLAVTLRDMGANEALIGASWMISAVSEIPVFYLLGKYGHKFRELPLLAFAAAVYALRFWLVSAFALDEAAWALPIQTLHSLSFGIFLSTSVRYITTLIPDAYRASGQAVYAAVWTGAAGLASGLGGGFIYDQAGPHSFFRFAALLALAACAGFLYRHYRTRRA